MEFFNNLILTIMAVGAVFFLYRAIKHQPALFSKDNLSKSFTTMGILALILIAVIGLVVVLLRG